MRPSQRSFQPYPLQRKIIHDIEKEDPLLKGQYHQSMFRGVHLRGLFDGSAYETISDVT